MMDYEYIKQTYGASFFPGDTVMLFGSAREGTVLPPKQSQLHYVNIQFSDGTTGLVHPHEATILARGPEWSAAQSRTADE